MSGKLAKRNIDSRFPKFLPSFQYFPNEILFKFFFYLSPKDLIICSKVCKSWNEACLSNQVWKMVFRKYQINRPIKSKISYFEEYRRRAQKFTTQLLSNEVEVRRKHHLYPAFHGFKNMSAQFCFSVYGERNKLIYSKLFINKDCKNLCQNNVLEGFALSLLMLITFNLNIPMVVKKCIPPHDAPGCFIEMNMIHLQSYGNKIQNDSCGCLSLQKFVKNEHYISDIEWHICIPRLLIGLWKRDKTLAYMLFAQIVEEEVAFTERKFVKSIPSSYMFHNLCSCKECVDDRLQKNIEQPYEQKVFRPLESMTDFKVIVVISIPNSNKMIFDRIWRSVDYIYGKSLELMEEPEPIEVDNFEFYPTLGHIKGKFQNIIKVEIRMVTRMNHPLWGYSAFHILREVKKCETNYDFEGPTQLFEDLVVKGRLIQLEKEYKSKIFISSLVLL